MCVVRHALDGLYEHVLSAVRKALVLCAGLERVERECPGFLALQGIENDYRLAYESVRMILASEEQELAISPADYKNVFDEEQHLKRLYDELLGLSCVFHIVHQLSVGGPMVLTAHKHLSNMVSLVHYVKDNAGKLSRVIDDLFVKAGKDWMWVRAVLKARAWEIRDELTALAKLLGADAS